MQEQLLNFNVFTNCPYGNSRKGCPFLLGKKGARNIRTPRQSLSLGRNGFLNQKISSDLGGFAAENIFDPVQARTALPLKPHKFRNPQAAMGGSTVVGRRPAVEIVEVVVVKEIADIGHRFFKALYRVGNNAVHSCGCLGITAHLPVCVVIILIHCQDDIFDRHNIADLDPVLLNSIYYHLQ